MHPRGLLTIAGLMVCWSLGLAGCKPRQSDSTLSGSVVPAGNLPPKTVYHYNEYQYLAPLGDSVAKVSQFLKNPSMSTYPSQRRGLYVGEHPSYNEIYVLDNLNAGSASSAWMAEITLKDECVNNAAVEPNLPATVGCDAKALDNRAVNTACTRTADARLNGKK